MCIDDSRTVCKQLKRGVSARNGCQHTLETCLDRVKTTGLSRFALIIKFRRNDIPRSSRRNDISIVRAGAKTGAVVVRKPVNGRGERRKRFIGSDRKRTSRDTGKATTMTHAQYRNRVRARVKKKKLQSSLFLRLSPGSVYVTFAFNHRHANK